MLSDTQPSPLLLSQCMLPVCLSVNDLLLHNIPFNLSNVAQALSASMLIPRESPKTMLFSGACHCLVCLREEGLTHRETRLIPTHWPEVLSRPSAPWFTSPESPPHTPRLRGSAYSSSFPAYAPYIFLTTTSPHSPEHLLLLPPSHTKCFRTYIMFLLKWFSTFLTKHIPLMSN